MLKAFPGDGSFLPSGANQAEDEFEDGAIEPEEDWHVAEQGGLAQPAKGVAEAAGVAAPPEAAAHGPRHADMMDAPLTDFERAQQHEDGRALDRLSESENQNAHKKLRPRRVAAHALTHEPADFTTYVRETKAKYTSSDGHKLDIMFLNLYGTLGGHKFTCFAVESPSLLDDTSGRMVPVIMGCRRQEGFIKQLSAASVAMPSPGKNRTLYNQATAALAARTRLQDASVESTSRIHRLRRHYNLATDKHAEFKQNYHQTWQVLTQLGQQQFFFTVVECTP